MDLQKEYEKRFGAFPLSNITYYLIAGQVVMFVLILVNPAVAASLPFQKILFLFMPATLSPLWAVFQWYFMYMIGNALENEWGAFKYFLYIFIGYFAALAGSIFFPASVVSNAFLFSSLFFAFAYLNPEVTLLLFFILPVKIKWLAWISWVALAATFLGGSSSTKVQILLSVVNFLIFFGREIVELVRDRKNHSAYIASQKTIERQIYMQCVVCHATQDDRKIFYYCHTCIPELCYCEDHLKQHKHKIIN